MELKEPAMISEFHMKVQKPEYPYIDTFCARVCIRACTHTHTQNKNETKSLQEYLGVCILLANFFWACSLLWTVSNRLQWQFVEKTDFPFVYGYQLQIISWLGLRSRVHFLFSVLGPHMAWTRAGPVHTVTASWVLYVSVLDVWKTRVRPWSHPSPLTLPRSSLDLEGRV